MCLTFAYTINYCYLYGSLFDFYERTAFIRLHNIQTDEFKLLSTNCIVLYRRIAVDYEMFTIHNV